MDRQRVDGHRRLVEEDVVVRPHRVGDGRPAVSIGDDLRDESLVIHVHDGGEKRHHVGDDGVGCAGLLLVLQRQRDVKVFSFGRQGVKTIQFDIPVTDQPRRHQCVDPQAVAHDVAGKAARMIRRRPEGVDVVGSGGTDQRRPSRAGWGFGVGNVGEVSVARQRLGQRPDDGRRAVTILDETGRRGHDGGQRSGEALVERLGDHDVRQRAVPVVPAGSGDGDGYTRLVGRDGVTVHSRGVLLAERAVDGGALTHRPQERIEHLRMVVYIIGGMTVEEHHPPIAGARYSDGRRARLRRVNEGRYDRDASRRGQRWLVEHIGGIGEPGESERVVGQENIQLPLVVRVGDAGLQVHSASGHQAGRLSDVGSVRLGIKKASALDKLSDGGQAVGPQRSDHLVGVADADGRQDKNIVVGEVGGNLRLGERVEVGAALGSLLAPQVDAEELLEVPLLPDDELVVLVAHGAVEEGDLTRVEGEGTRYVERTRGSHLIEVATQRTEDRAWAIVGTVHGAGDSTPGQVGVVVVIKSVPEGFVGIAALEVVGLSNTEGSERLPGSEIAAGGGSAQRR